MNKKILIVDKVHKDLVAKIAKRGLSCEVNPSIDYQTFMEMEDDIFGLFIRNRFKIDKALLDAKKNLRFIVRIGSGLENIDVAYAEKLGVRCISTPEGNSQSVAEHCLGFLICALKHFPIAHDDVLRGEWLREKNKGYEIGSRTIGIIGYGNTGSAFAKLLQPFGCKIYVYDKFNFGFEEDYVEEVPLHTLLEKCDVLSVHVNYLPENFHFINNELLKIIKKPFIFLNTSRGGVVDTTDLLKYIKNGRIQFACLDVLEYEDAHLQLLPKNYWPPVLHELVHMENVLVTPHIAGQTFEAEKRHVEVAVDKLCKIFGF